MPYLDTSVITYPSVQSLLICKSTQRKATELLEINLTQPAKWPRLRHDRLTKLKRARVGVVASSGASWPDARTEEKSLLRRQQLC